MPDIHRSSVHSQMMMINIRRIMAANEMRFADESHLSKYDHKKIEAEGKKTETGGGKSIHRKERSDSSHLSI